MRRGRDFRNLFLGHLNTDMTDKRILIAAKRIERIADVLRLKCKQNKHLHEIKFHADEILSLSQVIKDKAQSENERL